MRVEETSVKQKIEDMWRARAKVQGFKPHTKAYKNAELEFFIGAMAALNALHPGADGNMSALVPPWWVIAPLSGRNIVEKEKETQ